MSSFSRFRINSSKVINQTIDGEVIIVNLDSGSYYSLDKVGADIWELIESGATPGDVIETVTRRYDGGRADIEGAVNQLLADLHQEGLLLPEQGQHTEHAARHDPRFEPGVETERLPFEVPILHKYTDMQDLLLLDPIHDVDETGWPAARPDRP